MKLLLKIVWIHMCVILPASEILAQNQPVKPMKGNMQKGGVERGGGNEANPSEEFSYFSEQFADFRILRYNVPGFEQLTPRQRVLCYYLYEAALAGRDIFYDQGYEHNLVVRKTLEAILNNRQIDRQTEDYKKFEVYAKRVFFSNGIHHVYSNNKMLPGCTEEWFREQLKKLAPATLPLKPGQTPDQFVRFIIPILFDPAVAPKRVSLDAGSDLLESSAVNFYENVSEAEATAYYQKLSASASKNPPSFGLNTKLEKDASGNLREIVWKSGGMYGSAIDKILYWLEKAATVAENEQQEKVIRLLMDFYRTGDLETFDRYSIEWSRDTVSVVDFVNGFIEVYHDPLGYKGSWEAYVSIKDLEATKRIKAIGDQAQWFEDHSPIMDEHKKKEVRGISAKVINVVVEAGDLAPLTAIGINLPNSEWIREQYGSKSVTIGNIVYAYNEDGKTTGVVDEFYFNDDIKNRLRKYGAISDNLHTDMHEVIGHASGQINKGVGTTGETLKNYASTLEEARADLVALYFMADQKLMDIGVMPSLDAAKAEYDRYIMNGLMIQLTRLPANEHQLEESHMRNRQLIAAWVYEQGKDEKVIEKVSRDGKTFFVIRDYDKLRRLFGMLLREVQRIKSEGDYEAGKALVENYGVKVDPVLHGEVLARYSKLNIAPYRGFIQPRLSPITADDGEITDVKIQYPASFLRQMMNYGKNFSFLPLEN